MTNFGKTGSSDYPMGNHTTKEWLAIIQANALVIGQFERDTDVGLLVIK